MAAFSEPFSLQVPTSVLPVALSLSPPEDLVELQHQLAPAFDASWRWCDAHYLPLLQEGWVLIDRTSTPYRYALPDPLVVALDAVANYETFVYMQVEALDMGAGTAYVKDCLFATPAFTLSALLEEEEGVWRMTSHDALHGVETFFARLDAVFRETFGEIPRVYTIHREGPAGVVRRVKAWVDQEGRYLASEEIKPHGGEAPLALSTHEALVEHLKTFLPLQRVTRGA